jgi:hypothetical protein
MASNGGAEVALVIGTIQAGTSAAPSAPKGKRGKETRGLGGYNRPNERAAMMLEKDKTKKLALFLAIVNHSDNPTDSKEYTETWRGFYRNALLVKHCHDVCHAKSGTAFLAKYAPGNKNFSFGKWKCSDPPTAALRVEE